MWVMPMFGDRKPYSFLQEKYSTRSRCIFSRWKMGLLFTSFEAGHRKFMSEAFPKPGGQISRGRRRVAVWSNNGKEILYTGRPLPDRSGGSHGTWRQRGNGQAADYCFPPSAARGTSKPPLTANAFLMMQAPVQEFCRA